MAIGVDVTVLLITTNKIVVLKLCAMFILRRVMDVKLTTIFRVCNKHRNTFSNSKVSSKIL